MAHEPPSRKSGSPGAQRASGDVHAHPHPHAHPAPAHAHPHPHAPAHPPAPPHAHPHPPAHAPAHSHDWARGTLPRGAGRDKLLFIDAFSGIAGDMLVAALVDLGVGSDVIEAGLRSLPLAGYALRYSSRMRGAVAACGFDVEVQAAQPARDYAEIRGMFASAAGLPEGARRIALAALQLLAEAEAEVHGTSVEHVHFHEVGAVDSIVDIAAAAIALDHLGAAVICSPLPIGRGLVQTAHGPLPLPAPATLLCLRGVPTYDANLDAELVTPTGACLVRTVATQFARWPSLRPTHVGWGAGTRELADRPNALRLVLGEPDAPLASSAGQATHVVLELNIDDMGGELAAVALTRAQEAGALDVWSTPIGMKKGRPAMMLSALARRSEVDAVARALLSETTSLGVRLHEVGRIERKRRMVQVQTPYGPIAVKVADGDGLPENVAPEYEACRSAAEAHGVPVKRVYAAALAGYAAQEGAR